MMKPDNQPDLTETALALRAGKLSAEFLLAEILEKIEHFEPQLNCFITLDVAAARVAASASAARLRAGQPLSVLDGIPMALKDNMDVAGMPTSAGTAAFHGAKKDAVVAARLRGAGAVMLGKLNMDECAFGVITDNPHHGATQNPWRQGYTPGGSSGGSGAAVAAGLVLAALGTDTLGSVRIPAAFCGVVGLKPTLGLISTQGVIPLSASLDHVGPICRSVRDAVVLLDMIDGGEPTATPADWRRDLDGIRIGVLEEGGDGDWTDEVRAGFDAAKNAMSELGATLAPLSLVDTNLGVLRRQAVLVIEAEGADALAERLEAASDTVSDGLKMMFAYGRDAPASRLEQAHHALTETSAAIRNWFADVDLVASPMAPQTAFSFDGPAPVNTAEISQLANISGCPAIALPCGVGPSGLPLSMQLMAPPFDEANMLGPAQVLENKWGRFSPPTGDAG